MSALAEDLIHTSEPDRVWLWDRECGAIDQSEFMRMPGHHADVQALPNPIKLYCLDDAESDILPIARALLAGYSITEPIVLKIFTHDWSRFGGAFKSPLWHWCNRGLQVRCVSQDRGVVF